MLHTHTVFILKAWAIGLIWRQVTKLRFDGVCMLAVLMD